MPAKRGRKRRMQPARKNKPKTVRRRTPRRVRRPRRRRSTPKEAHFNALLVLLSFLYMLKLINEKQFRRLQREISPQKKAGPKRRRRK